MLRRTILLSVLLLVSVIIFAQSQIVTFSGKIENPNSETVFIKAGNFIKKFKLSDSGVFSDTLKIPSQGIYTFSDGRESSAIYLKNGYNLNLSLDTKMFDESLKYTGEGSENNNFLVQKYLINEQGLGDPYKLFAMNEKDYMEVQNSVNNKYSKLLDQLKDKEFAEFQKKSINYDYLYTLTTYESAYKYVTKDTSFVVSESFLDPLKEISYSNEEDYQNFESYKILVNSHYLSDLYDSAKIKEIITSINSIDSKIIKAGVNKDIITSYFDLSNPSIQVLYQTIVDVYGNEEDKAVFTEKYDEIKKLFKGQPSAKFEYKDINGKLVKLDDFKGKYVYIDVWATWCGPCLGEIPHLKKLEADYHDKDIAFISISVDKKRSFSKWEKMVKEKELKGYQLFADKDWSSDFIKAYQIKGIPTFILIDPDGNIYSASAMRPSNPEIRNLFNKLLN